MKMANHHPTFALDCSVKSITIAIIKDGQILSSYNDIPQTSQSEELMKIIDNVLKEAKLQFTDIKQVLFCNGPGSFTSLRVGLATVKGLFWEAGVDFYTTSSLLFRCFSIEEQRDEKRISLIRMGREKVAAGILEKGEAQNFQEGIYANESFEKHLHDQEDITDPNAFLKIIESQSYQHVDINEAKINYLVEPDLGKKI